MSRPPRDLARQSGGEGRLQGGIVGQGDGPQARHRLVLLKQIQLLGFAFGVADLDTLTDVRGRHLPETSADGNGGVFADFTAEGAIEDEVQLLGGEPAVTNATQRAQIAIQGTLPGASVQAPVVMLLEPVLEAGVEIVQPGEGCSEEGARERTRARF